MFNDHQYNSKMQPINIHGFLRLFDINNGGPTTRDNFGDIIIGITLIDVLQYFFGLWFLE
jgi:hypothetical protein